MKNKEEDDGPSSLEMGWFMVKNARVFYQIFSLIRKAVGMKDPKTTVSGIIAALALLARAFQFDIPQAVIDGILAVSLYCIGKFAGDSK